MLLKSPTLSNLPTKIWQRFSQLPILNEIVLISNEQIKAILFLLDRDDKQILRSSYENCLDLADYFQFSEQVFSSHQIKHEILSFLEFARNEKPRNVCEIGTADGGTNFLLSQALPTVELMIGVDLHVKNQTKLNYFSKPSQELNFINNSSSKVSTLHRFAKILGHRKLDILFIDGDHTYDGVKQDFLNYRKFVREEGLIVFHDIIPDYLTRYGKKTGRWVGDVPRFWSEIKTFYPIYEFVENPNQDGLGIGVIRYSSDVSLPKAFD